MLTLMFSQMPGNQDRRLKQMQDEAERFYRRFLTRAVRQPRSGFYRGKLPIMIAMPDKPVGKSTSSLKNVTINDGLHLGGVLLVPPGSRLRVAADEHFRTNREMYLRPHFEKIEALGNVVALRRPAYLQEIDIRRADDRAEALVSYTLKSLPRLRFTRDDILILPRAISELEDRDAS